MLENRDLYQTDTISNAQMDRDTLGRAELRGLELRRLCTEHGVTSWVLLGFLWIRWRGILHDARHLASENTRLRSRVDYLNRLADVHRKRIADMRAYVDTVDQAWRDRGEA